MVIEILIGFLLLSTILALIIIRIRNNGKIDEIWRSLERQPMNEVAAFSQRMVSDLPVPVQRYFLHAIQPGTPLASSVVLKMIGEMKLSRMLSGFRWKLKKSSRYPECSSGKQQPGAGCCV